MVATGLGAVHSRTTHRRIGTLLEGKSMQQYPHPHGP